MTVELTIVLAIVGSFVGVAGLCLSFLSTRDKKTQNDSEWKGRVDAKLDMAIAIRNEVEELKANQHDHGKRIALVEQSAKSAHYRLDELAGGKRRV